MIPASAAFAPDMDDIPLGQDFDMSEDTGAPYIAKQFDQLARLLRPGRQRLYDQTPLPVAQSLPDQVIVGEFICHDFVTYRLLAVLSIVTRLGGCDATAHQLLLNANQLDRLPPGRARDRHQGAQRQMSRYRR